MTARGAVGRQKARGPRAVRIKEGGNPEEQRQPPVGHLHISPVILAAGTINHPALGHRSQ